MNTQLHKQIDEMVHSSKVFLFMKGTPDHPECGFSMHTVSALQQLGIEFKSFNVLADESIRQGIKEYASWPTIPQLYINAKFVGGCDITLQLAESGELKRMVESE